MNIFECTIVVGKTANVFFALKTLEWIFYRLIRLFEPKPERKFELIT